MKNIIIAVLIGAVIYFAFFASPEIVEKTKIVAGETKQVYIDRPIYIGKSITNDIIKTNAFVLQCVDELNRYRTNKGWISITNSKIYAGLVNRVWSLDYNIKTYVRRHTTSLYVGNGIAASYQYLLTSRISVGGIVYNIDSRAGIMAGAGFKF